MKSGLLKYNSLFTIIWKNVTIDRCSSEKHTKKTQLTEIFLKITKILYKVSAQNLPIFETFGSNFFFPFKWCTGMGSFSNLNEIFYGICWRYGSARNLGSISL